MKCKHAQRCLLSTSGPRKLADDVLAHLDGCPDCKAWQVRLAAIDRSVPYLPVPDSSEAKDGLIEQILFDPATLPFSRRWWQRGTAWQRGLVAVAASALVLLIAGRAFRPSPTPAAARPTDPLLAKLLDQNLSFAKATTELKRVETLAGQAQVLEAETRNLARVASAEELKTLADLYDDVINKGLLVQAQVVHEDDRDKVLKIADQLFKTSKDVAQLAREVPSAAAPSLNRMAAVAGNANEALRKTRENKVATDTPPKPREGKS